ncbi:tryptophan synthase subunit alpha [Aureispira anguillae]|uniref:Tryptophan synthase alpha chain n=1 Tax=Aureispira anguillae TaxID=2864201 RepID=A0A915YK11_9BACT|nr:tryptophan synthase subunit alpha [Aureispira anguillae]BDS14490.1 tryptophan synthase subunit alpha [Aureispira anguillae]
MNRINQLFERKQKEILNIYCTAGYPKLESTEDIVLGLDQAGVDLVEIGMPYSDPLADGPTIQASSTIALNNGMSIKKLFEQIEQVRKQTNLPIILMGYINPVMQYGVETFLEACQRVGVDGLILPDLPMYEYENHYQASFEAYDIRMIFLVTPQTSTERIKKIDQLSNAFIYVVSSAATTGKQTGFGEENIAYFKRIKALKLKNPTLIGFGISDATAYQSVCEYANGAIIGSAFIRMLEHSNQIKQDIRQFVVGIKGEIAVK